MHEVGCRRWPTSSPNNLKNHAYHCECAQKYFFEITIFLFVFHFKIGVRLMLNIDTWMSNKASENFFSLSAGLHDLVVGDIGVTTMEYALLASLLAMLIILSFSIGW